MEVGYTDELAVKAAVAAALPTTVDRGTAVQYLLAWQEEPCVDHAPWDVVDALVRTEAHWPTPTSPARC
jgi:hypothetical protein